MTQALARTIEIIYPSGNILRRHFTRENKFFSKARRQTVDLVEDGYAVGYRTLDGYGQELPEYSRMNALARNILKMKEKK